MYDGIVDVSLWIVRELNSLVVIVYLRMQTLQLVSSTKRFTGLTNAIHMTCVFDKAIVNKQDYFWTKWLLLWCEDALNDEWAALWNLQKPLYTL